MSLLTFLFGCGSSKLVEGGIYYTPQEDGTYAPFKILKIDDGGVHVRLYSNQYTEPPKNIDEATLYMAGLNKKPNERMGMGHAPVSKKSFETWKAKFVQQSTVSEQELEGYKMWLEAKGGYF